MPGLLNCIAALLGVILSTRIVVLADAPSLAQTAIG
jgi:hypothetical protein